MNTEYRKMTIAGKDIANYTLVLAENHTPVEQTAADELFKYVKQTCGVELARGDDRYDYDCEIVIGKTNREGKYYDVDRGGFGDDGYIIFAKDNRLVFAGAKKRGTMYAVYDFIEYVLGWKFYTGELEVMRGKGDIDVPADYKREFVPVFEYRELDWVCVRDRHTAAKFRINGNYRHFGEEFGGELKWGGEIHSFANYFDNMKESSQQPCLSDPKNIEMVIEKIAKRLEENPDVDLFEISQNDNQNYCKCENCTRIDEEDESHAGTNIRFINALSDAFREKYPKLHFQTFAYQYTRKPPKVTKPNDNIVIKLCPMECSPSHPLFDRDCEPNREFYDHLTGWNEITKKIYIWDYVTNYAYFIAPFPNLHLQRENLRFFADNHVKGYYPEGNYICPSGEFGELRAYLLSKAMWNPYISAEEYQEEMNGFMEAYYGEGWEYLLDFIKFTEEESAKVVPNMWSHPFEMITRDAYNANRERLDKDWDEAERLAVGPQKLNVQKSRCQYKIITLTLDYDERYTNGDDQSKTNYLIENCLFYNFLAKYDIGWREAAMYSITTDFSKPPLKWFRPHTYGGPEEPFLPGWIENDFI